MNGRRAWNPRSPWLSALLGTLVLSACGGGGGDQTAAAPAAAAGATISVSGVASSSVQSVRTNSPPVITGLPASMVKAGWEYDFLPAALDDDGNSLGFSITNKPSWATFDTGTGELRGTPTLADMGSYADIAISVSDGSASTALPDFSIVVAWGETGVATLSWTTPLENADHSQLTDLAGYHIYYGSSPDALTKGVLASPLWRSYQVPHLAPGTWYFAMTAFNADGVESALSDVVNKTIDF